MKTKPFLTVFTRCCRRPRQLDVCIQSVVNQTCHDIEQFFVIDKSLNHKEGGIRWANKQFSAHKNHVIGDYVFMLDDDGKIIHTDFVRRLKDIVRKNNSPDVVLVKTLRQAECSPAVYPRDHIWSINWERGHRPKKFEGNGECFVTKTSVWRDYIDVYHKGNTGGDFRFISALIKNKRISFLRFDICVTMQQARNRGKVFETKDTTWYIDVFKKHCVEIDGMTASLPLWKR